jgi:GT2 family glycosyltransferase
MTLTLPKVSIVVTVKNEEENIAALLDSILKLEYSGETETIIVDGGSNDKTISIISSYPSVKLITTKCNISRGRNIGMKNSSGEIIAFTDGDCVVDKDWIKNIVKHFSKDSEIAVVGGPYLPLSQHGLIAKYLAIYQSTYFPTESGFTTYQHIAAGNAAFRREVIEKVGGFDERLIDCEDEDLNLRVSNLGYKLFFAEDVIVYHKSRTTLKEASRFAFDRGKASSIFNRKHNKYRHLLFPYFRTLLLILGTFLIINILTGNHILVVVELAVSFTSYYFYRLLRFEKNPHHLRMSLATRFGLPLIDLYIRLLDSFGSLVELLKISNVFSKFRLKILRTCKRFQRARFSQH